MRLKEVGLNSQPRGFFARSVFILSSSRNRHSCNYAEPVKD